jgi:hypothetical protein
MKRKLLAILSLTYFASISAFAMQMDGAKLISHKVWGANNIKLSFKETQPDQNKVKMLMSRTKHVEYDQLVGAGTQVTKVSVYPAGSNSSMETNNWLFIFNATSDPKMYTVNHSVCPMKVYDDGSVTEEVCSYSSDTIWLDAHKIYNTWGTTILNWTPTEAGRYGFTFETSVQPSSESTILFETGDFAVVNVPSADQKAL